MNPEDEMTIYDRAQKARDEEMLRVVRKLVGINTIYDQWLRVFNSGVFPEVSEADRISFAGDMWPLIIRLSLNKKLISDIVERFTDLGWTAQPWQIFPDTVTVRMSAPKSVGSWYTDVHLIACGNPDGCEIIPIDKKERIMEDVTYELVCGDGASENAFEVARDKGWV